MKKNYKNLNQINFEKIGVVNLNSNEKIEIIGGKPGVLLGPITLLDEIYGAVGSFLDGVMHGAKDAKKNFK